MVEHAQTQTQSLTPTQQEIAVHAYHLWEQEGRPTGREKDHWKKAEQQLLEIHKQEERSLRHWEKANGIREKQPKHNRHNSALHNS